MGESKQINHYYPYCGPWGDASTNQGFQPYKYNSKELDRVHGLDWYDYGARRYDPAYCMFTQMDPLAEQYLEEGRAKREEEPTPTHLKGGGKG